VLHYLHEEEAHVRKVKLLAPVRDHGWEGARVLAGIPGIEYTHEAHKRAIMQAKIATVMDSRCSK
jgi:PII-like signaling protein